MATTPQQVFIYNETFTADPGGQINLSGSLSVKDFSKVSLLILQFPHKPGISMNVTCQMGLSIEDSILLETVGFFPLPPTLEGLPEIHTFDVVGPEFLVHLTQGAPYGAVPILGWLFLH